MTAKELRNLRESAGLTQEEMAALLLLPVQTYRNREAGRSRISDEAAELCKLKLKGK